VWHDNDTAVDLLGFEYLVMGSLSSPLQRMRQFAVAQTNDDAIITGNLDHARDLLAEADFFSRVFDEDEADLELLHRSAVATLRADANEWSDLRPVNGPAVDDDGLATA
jgi:hypothetical protein